MNTTLVNRITSEIENDQGIAGEFLTYMALLRLPPPCRVLFNYKIMAEEVALAEIDMLLITRGGMFVIEVKNKLSQSGEIIRHNKERIRLLRERLSAGKKSLPIHSLIVFHNERADKWVWSQEATLFTHYRYLLPTIAWLISQQPKALSNERIAGLSRQLQGLTHQKPRQKKPAPVAKPKPAPQKHKIELTDERDKKPMVHRVYTGRREDFDGEAQLLLKEWREQLGAQGLARVEIFHRYDIEGIDAGTLQRCIPLVFSQPQADVAVRELQTPDAAARFAMESLPGQYDQRADSAAQCIQVVSGGERPMVRTAKVYVLHGDVSTGEFAAIKKSTINPVECREAGFELPQTLGITVEHPKMVRKMEGFRQLNETGLQNSLKKYALAMDIDDLRFCQAYFQSENRDPSVTEIRMIDTYWSDHCRHTTFLTHLDEITIEDPRAQKTYERFLEIKRELGRADKPTTLMEVATQAMRWLKHTGQLERLDESDEINACTVKTDVIIDGKAEPWLFLFKNETHNHPTEIEPFGGAATCIGGAIRDPLSGRGYCYQAMRITGAADPTVPVGETIPGKLPQRKLVTAAAQGYSSYANQIGLAAGLVDEIYHPGYMAKRMELGAVVAAVPQAWVRREVPQPGDKVILLGGRTGRDGCGGATGSSKSHSLDSLESCGAEVQKGDAPLERKIVRLFRNPKATQMIKRCNDFGAGGVSVAIGELCDGLVINLDAVPTKYEGLDGTEIAISESQERMAIVVDACDADAFLALARGEGLEATVVAEVQENPRLQMHWNGKMIVDLAREFLNSNGAAKSAKAFVNPAANRLPTTLAGTFTENMRNLAGSLAVCSKRGASERFDSTAGTGTVFMPFGGHRQQTPLQVMAAKIPVLDGETDNCSVMAYGYDPYLTEADPYKGAYCAVLSSVAKLAAAGCPLGECYLSFQEYFERMACAVSWGKPLAALLGALQAQLDLGLASIGGKDSMSGTFEQINVPPTLVSFAVALTDCSRLISNEFKQAGNVVAYVAPPLNADGLPLPEKALDIFSKISALAATGKIISAQAITSGGIAEAILKMGLGNRIGFRFTPEYPLARAFIAEPGAIVFELAEPCGFGCPIGHTIADYEIRAGEATICLEELEALYENKLEPVFPTQAETNADCQLSAVNYQQRSSAAPAIKTAKPRVLIPAFPGTTGEYDTARAFAKAGAEPEILVVSNQAPQALSDSVERMAKALAQAQVMFLPGGMSAGGEPDGSGKFIAALLRNPKLSEAVMELLDKRMGLIGGIGDGFHALMKLGLVPFGKITDMRADCPALTFNSLGRHQSKLVRSRVASVLSPWLALCEPGEIQLAPISSAEGRFACPAPMLQHLIGNGQIATQYVGLDSNPSMDIQYNPFGSLCAIEGITSPDGRVFGRMAHSERTGPGLYRNVPGSEADSKMFQAAVDYFK